MSSIGKAWAIVRGRLTGNIPQANELLQSMPKSKLLEVNRQESAMKGSRRKKKPYKLGEKVRTVK